MVVSYVFVLAADRVEFLLPLKPRQLFKWGAYLFDDIHLLHIRHSKLGLRGSPCPLEIPQLLSCVGVSVDVF